MYNDIKRIGELLFNLIYSFRYTFTMEIELAEKSGHDKSITFETSLSAVSLYSRSPVEVL